MDSLSSPVVLLPLLARLFAGAMLLTEILLVWTGRRGQAARDDADALTAAPLGRFAWAATPALIVVGLVLWTGVTIAPSRGGLPPAALAATASAPAPSR